jgi:putative proteasome-type protease
MTYGIGMKINNGLLFMSDTRTNAGVDNISTFKKMFSWTNERHSVVTILAAGNLATTQSLISIFQGNGDGEQNLETTILEQNSMFDVARSVGRQLRKVIQANSDAGQKANSYFMLP